MNPIFEHHLLQTRRQFFGDAGLRLGSLALGMLMGSSASGNRRIRRNRPPGYIRRCRACRIFPARPNR